MRLFGWTNGELLIWMDPDRGLTLKPLAQKFHDDFGINATIETPQNITDSFPLAAQVAKGPDIVMWAHDKVGEWADGGLIAPVEISEKYAHKFFPKAWQAVLHENRTWGYPIALETVTLIYNRKTSRRSSSDRAFPAGVGKSEDQNETSRGDRDPVGLQECLLFMGDSR